MRRLISIGFLVSHLMSSSQSGHQAYSIPLGGNSWVRTSGKEKVTGEGWQNWERKEAVWSTYFKVREKGTLQISILLNVPKGKSEIAISVAGVSHKVIAAGADDKLYNAGTWKIATPGYIEVRASGVTKTGNIFAIAKALQISGESVDSNVVFVKNNEDNYFYWGRRGASCHINYDMSAVGDEAEWFYSEITVPAGGDPPGSYFMADGFAEGYFGMQVNSPTERRIIFSVWSPFKTDNPKNIPQDQRILLVKKGKQVITEEFGGEGSGGHSHLVYNWKAGQTYKFLLHGKPLLNNSTNFTAYFFDRERNQWILLASFTRPATHTYLKRFHSFLENFEPEAGDITRKAFYHNQWVKPVQGDWVPINKMTVTVDLTGKKKFRTDYDGGVENGKFYLRNGGFFNETATLKKVFEGKSEQKPAIDLNLPDE